MVFQSLNIDSKKIGKVILVGGVISFTAIYVKNYYCDNYITGDDGEEDGIELKSYEKTVNLLERMENNEDAPPVAQPSVTQPSVAQPSVTQLVEHQRVETLFNTLTKLLI